MVTHPGGGRPWHDSRMDLFLATALAVAACMGALWLLSVIFGQKAFPVGKDGALSVGLLYGAHGLGALVGATLTELLHSRFKVGLLSTIRWAFAVRALLFAALALSFHLAFAMVILVGISACGSLLWISSTTLLQRVP